MPTLGDTIRASTATWKCFTPFQADAETRKAVNEVRTAYNRSLLDAIKGIPGDPDQVIRAARSVLDAIAQDRVDAAPDPGAVQGRVRTCLREWSAQDSDDKPRVMPMCAACEREGCCGHALDGKPYAKRRAIHAAGAYTTVRHDGSRMQVKKVGEISEPMCLDHFEVWNFGQLQAKWQANPDTAPEVPVLVPRLAGGGTFHPMTGEWEKPNAVKPNADFDALVRKLTGKAEPTLTPHEAREQIRRTT